MKKPALVSVIMPVFKEQKHILKEAVDSILTQKYSTFELIVVLDNPKNKTAEKLLKGYAKSDKRVRVIKNARNIGRGASRNKAVKNAKGNFIAILDADDVALPSRLSEQVRHFQKHHDVQLLFSQATLINQQSKVVGKLSPKACHAKKLRKYLFIDNVLIHPTMMVRAKILQQRLYNESFLRSQDFEFWIRCLREKLIFDVIEKPLVNYRVPDRSNLDERIRRQGQYSKYSVKALSKHFKGFLFNPYYAFAFTKYLFFRLLVILIPSSIIKIFLQEEKR